MGPAVNKKLKMKIKFVQETNESKFAAEVLHMTMPALVGFLAPWSKPCQLIWSVLDEVGDVCEGKVKVFTMNVDDNPDLGTRYAIQSVPTLIFFINGAVRLKIIGTVSSKAVIAKLLSLTSGNTSTEKTNLE